MAWVYLIIAGLLEIGWPVGLKMSQEGENRWLGIGVAVAFMVASGFMLWLAQRYISMGTSYAVWTGIGAAGTFIVGILFYNDAATFGRVAGVLMIISGVITLKISH
ncbi:multidrug efflux SMR transporter [Pseudoalteromonas sp. NEC-BIFX-2020_002]|uniref:DMT family transporter n=1 Tax=Pseudoalteromonas sp. NEC-BIFX-2020_002 TaxID=2732353 RepID=UPI001476DAAB|nr:multidrug efflux SMR transporter [Pseudoalteromonas sp. NEC-BIFX-2020_002]NNG42660.1 multidrug efflux SMR transporter [Pseudoalteromonas sp. NEC-BIFX-2020_002]